MRSVLALLVSVLVSLGAAVPAATGRGRGGAISTGTAKNATGTPKGSTVSDPNAVKAAVASAVQNANDARPTT